MRSRMLALVAGLLFLGSVVGVAVVSRSAGGGDLPKLPFGAAGAERAGASTAAAADMALYRPVTYKLADGLERPTDKATAYRLVVGPAQAQRVAKALGLSGEAKAAEGSGWTVTDGTRVLRLDGSGSWNLFDDPCRLESGAASSGSGPVEGSAAGDDPASTPADEKPAPVAPLDSKSCVLEGGSVSGGGGEPGTAPGSEPATDGSGSSGSSAGSTGSADTRASEAEAEARSSEPTPPATVVCPMPYCPDGSACTQECSGVDQQPVRPADLPSKAEARAQVVKILEAMGFDAEHGGLRIEDGFTVWSATYEPYIDGTRAADLSVSISVGSKGRIDWASGWVASYEQVGDYPLATLATALKRLNVGFEDGPRPMVAGDASEPAIAEDNPVTETTVARAGSDSEAATTTSPVSREPVECGGPTGDCVQTAPVPCNDTPELTADCAYPEPACEPAPAPVPPAAGSEQSILIEPVPAPLPPVSGSAGDTTAGPAGCTPWTPPEPEVVTLTSVSMGLTLAPVFDGTKPAYVVPAFVFGGANTSDVTVVAVVDELLEKAEPEPATKPGSDEPAPADGGTPVTLIAPVPKD